MGRVGFWFRLLALLIDTLIVLIVYVLAVAFFSLSEDRAALVFVAAWLIYTSPEIFTAGTLGKRILGIKIGRSNGTNADCWTLFLRWSTKQYPQLCGLLFLLTALIGLRFVGGISEAFVVIGCLYALNESKQTWHDEWASTAVFRRRDMLARRPPPPTATIIP
jgi:uncharacterized RDD family membrane protein YckC